MYERLPEVQDNFLAFLGHGMTQAQMDGTSTTDYLDTVVPPIPAGKRSSESVVGDDDNEDAEAAVSKKIAFV